MAQKRHPTRRPGKPRNAAPKALPASALRNAPSAPYRLKENDLERALVTGEHTDLLQRYFGEEEHAELRELARTASSRSVRGGPRVLILPGIMGSTLGSPRPLLLLDDVIWIDPIDIAAGNLTTLALIPGPARYRALGVVLIAYLKLKLRLRIGGYDVDFHAYDWRQNLDTLGVELARRIANDSAGEISLVAHSMGGLVSRAALLKGATKVKRLIMLGTPNYGSFVPVQALRATYSVVRKVALLDLHHSPEQLAEQVFSTFPGLYQMLPAPEKFNHFDLFDGKNWPATGPRPRQELLAVAKKAQSLLAPPDERFVLVAGINQDTATDVRVENGEFVYAMSREGDGTVPLALAQLPDVKTYFIEESHGSLPNNASVGAAVGEILGTGVTDLLPQTWTPARAGIVKTLDEEAARRAVPDAREHPRGAAISDKEMRYLIEEVASPSARDVPVKGAPEQRYTQQLHRVVIGRRRQRRLDIRLALGSITEANSRAYVLGTFSDVTPTGAAQAVDARLDGAIAECSRRRMFSANVGEVFILPTGSHALRPDVVLLAGLGPFDRFNDDVLELVAENVVRTFVATGIDDFATVLIGGGSGRDTGATLRRLLQGFLRGLADADKGQNFRRVTLCERDPEQCNAIKRELYFLATTELFSDVELTFEEETLPEAAEPAPPSRGLAGTAEAPAYLMVRQESLSNGQPEIQASVLTSGAKAAILVCRNPLEKKALDALLARMSAPTFTFSTLDSFGKDLAKLLLPADLRAVLSTVKQRHLVVVHDELASRIPWETMRLDDWAPATTAGLSRRYMAENLSVAKWLEERRQNPILNMLLVINPTGDLQGAEDEGERIRTLFGSHSGVRIVQRRGDEANKPTLLKDFSSGVYDVIHYAGHAYFDTAHPSHSGILCHGRQVLSGSDLVSVGRLPSLIFFNACEAGRIRGGARIRSADAKAPKPPTSRERMEQNVGLAEAFLRGGAANYLGTFWPVGDASAKRFAEVFYTELMQGKPLGSAILTARQEVRKIKSVDWADYILYGSHDFVLKIRED